MWHGIRFKRQFDSVLPQTIITINNDKNTPESGIGRAHSYNIKWCHRNKDRWKEHTCLQIIIITIVIIINEYTSTNKSELEAQDSNEIKIGGTRAQMGGKMIYLLVRHGDR